MNASPAADTDRRSLNGAFVGILLANCAASFLVAGAGVYTASALAAFGSEALLGLTFTLEGLGRCLMLPVAANLGDRFGRRRIFLVGVAAFLCSTLACAVAPNAALFLAGRTAMGFAWGLFLANGFALINDTYGARSGARRTGYAQAAGTAAMLAGPPLAGLCADWLTWRLALGVAVPLLGIAYTLASRCLQASNQARTGVVDIGGLLLLAAVLTPFTLAMAWGGRSLPWNSVAIYLLAGLAAVGLAALARVESKASVPIFPADVLSHRAFRTVFAISFFSAMVGSAGNFLPAFVQEEIGASATASGIVSAPGLVVSAVGAALLGRRLAATQRFKGAVAFWALAVTAVTAVYASFGAHTTLMAVVGSSSLLGLALTPMMVVPYTFAMAALPAAQVSSGVGLLAFGAAVANTLGSGVMTAVADTGLANVFRCTVVFAIPCLAAAIAFRFPASSKTPDAQVEHDDADPAH
jgi:MFS family permease